ncbi:hypothetical protein J6590_086740 [Homalodisca vitripennis]|nr:hypothetical protein J6590_086740 [Homalodisca vitripennis]
MDRHNRDPLLAPRLSAVDSRLVTHISQLISGNITSRDCGCGGVASDFILSTENCKCTAPRLVSGAGVCSAQALSKLGERRRRRALDQGRSGTLGPVPCGPVRPALSAAAATDWCHLSGGWKLLVSRTTL